MKDLHKITLLSQSLGNAKKKISDLTTGLTKLTEMYNNGLISLDEYNDKSSEYRKEIRNATSDVKRLSGFSGVIIYRRFEDRSRRT